jgi:hypothetical protein
LNEPGRGPGPKIRGRTDEREIAPVPCPDGTRGALRGRLRKRRRRGRHRDAQRRRNRQFRRCDRDQGTEGATGADSDAGTGSEAATGDGTGAGAAPSREEYIAQADEICRKAEEEFTKAVEQGFEGQSPNQEEVGAALETAFTENLEGQLGDLRALTPPAGDEQALAAMYESLELAIQEIADDPSSLASPSRAMKDASRRARAYGLEQCGS